MTATTRRMLLLTTASGLVAAALPAAGQAPRAADPVKSPDTEWRHYAGDLANTHYVPLEQINAENFNSLEVAWRFKTDSLGARPEFNLQSTPLLIKGRLFSTAGSRRDVVCLDATTGELLWLFRFDEGARAVAAPRQFSGRGVSYWTDGADDERILYVTPGYQLIALDAKTGHRISNFGENGVVDLRKDADQEMDLETADIGLHATPLVARDVVVVGAAHASSSTPTVIDNAKGYVRGFDVRTGKRLWTFHTIPRKGEVGYESWIAPGQAETTGNTGVWAQMSADPELGLVYLPVELPTGDFNGERRKGDALFGESLVAVELETGKYRWHYQTEHHGLWDRDLPCAAVLMDLPVGGKMVKALALPTKQAFLFVLNRETGKPIWPIKEVRVPKGDVPNEWYSPTQPVPSKPPPFDYQHVGPDTVINFTPELHAQALKVLENYKAGDLYTPPSLSQLDGTLGTLFLPGSTGGVNWPGGSYDPETGHFYVFSQSLIRGIGMIPNPGKDVTNSDLSHIVGVAGRAPTRARQGAMGATSVAARSDTGSDAPQAAQAGTMRPNSSLVIQGLPFVRPPYGRITAIDLNQGSIAWQVAHGETPDNIKNNPALNGLTIPRTGQAGQAGILVTKALVVAGEPGMSTTATGRRGAMLRAYDKRTGEEKGAVYLPAAQTGTPMSYMQGGRQYIVVAVGGAGNPGEFIAFRLRGA